MPEDALIPRVSAGHIRELLHSVAEDPVLYVRNGPDDDGDGPLDLSVWAGAYVHPQVVVVTRVNLCDTLGMDPSPDAEEARGWDDPRIYFSEELAALQHEVDRICEEILDAARDDDVEDGA